MVNSTSKFTFIFLVLRAGFKTQLVFSVVLIENIYNFMEEWSIFTVGKATELENLMLCFC